MFDDYSTILTADSWCPWDSDEESDYPTIYKKDSKFGIIITEEDNEVNYQEELEHKYIETSLAVRTYRQRELKVMYKKKDKQKKTNRKCRFDKWNHSYVYTSINYRYPREVKIECKRPKFIIIEDDYIYRS